MMVLLDFTWLQTMWATFSTCLVWAQTLWKGFDLSRKPSFIPPWPLDSLYSLPLIIYRVKLRHLTPLLLSNHDHLHTVNAINIEVTTDLNTVYAPPWTVHGCLYKTSQSPYMHIYAVKDQSITWRQHQNRYQLLLELISLTGAVRI